MCWSLMSEAPVGAVEGAERQTAEEVAAPIDRGFGQVDWIIDEGTESHQGKQDLCKHR